MFDHKKILIIGCGGAGKSTFARAMGEKLGIGVVHLDKLWWLPQWVERDEAEFDELLLNELAKSEWIMDGNFLRTFELRLQFADFAIMLDIDADECMRSVLARGEQYKGKTRPDMTDGCEEHIDDNFRDWILHYATDVRDKMLEILINSGKPFEVFDSREKAYKWLNEID